MKLPNGLLVYPSTEIVKGIPLTWGEVTANCVRVPETQELVTNAIRLTKTWAEVREKWGGPLIITSGYRPPRVNQSVGGARNSQHLYFRALDFYPENGNLDALWKLLQGSGFTGLGDGRKKGFIHADIRPGSRIVFDY